MAGEKEDPGNLAWRVMMPDVSSAKMASGSGVVRKVWIGLLGLILALKLRVCTFLGKAWRLGVDDPRKVVHSLKVGLALTLVSIFYYTRTLYDTVGGNAMWAIMTVVLIFEYTAGATVSKGLNRVMATTIAGSLAVGFHLIANQSGEKVEPLIRGIAVFLLASVATFTRFIPEVKTRFDYGAMIFILTFSFVSVSGYRVEKLFQFAQQRLSTIVIGSSMCMLVTMLVCPIWAGEDLHLLVIRNMEKIASSLDGCVAEYFKDSESESDTSKGEPSQKSQGYKSVLNSKAMEDSLANFARWEPAHGRFGFRHPWKQYLKIGTTVRNCAYCIEALNGCIDNEIQAPDFIKKHLGDTCMRLSSQSSGVLKELANAIKNMRRSSKVNILLGEMNCAVDDLQNALRSLPHQQLPPPSPSPPPVETTDQEEKTQPTLANNVPLIEVLPLGTVVSLLIEIAARIEGVIDAVKGLADLAEFEPPADQKSKQNQLTHNSLSQQQGKDATKVVQLV